MQRRGYMGLAGVMIFCGCSEAKQFTEDVSATGHSHIKEVEWTNNRKTLRVTFPNDHDADYIVMNHEYDDKNVIWYSEAPRFSGPVSIPMMKAVACDNANYPTPVFEIFASNGRPFVDLMEEILDSRQVKVNDKWLTRAKEMELEPFECQRM